MMRCVRSTSGVPETTSAPEPTGWPPTATWANVPAPGIWCGGFRTPPTASSNCSRPSSCRSCAACRDGPWAWDAISPWPRISRSRQVMPCSGSRSWTADSGSTWLLPRLVGVARARRMLLLGEKVNAADAAEWGLIHQAVIGAELEDTVEQLLARLADGPTVAIGLAKQALGFGAHATLAQSMNQELSNLELSCRTKDFKEGLEAFRQRRAPKFHGL